MERERRERHVPCWIEAITGSHERFVSRGNEFVTESPIDFQPAGGRFDVAKMVFDELIAFTGLRWRQHSGSLSRQRKCAGWDPLEQPLCLQGGREFSRKFDEMPRDEV